VACTSFPTVSETDFNAPARSRDRVKSTFKACAANVESSMKWNFECQTDQRDYLQWIVAARQENSAQHKQRDAVPATAWALKTS
jgi:hypothetical protein